LGNGDRERRDTTGSYATQTLGEKAESGG